MTPDTVEVDRLVYTKIGAPDGSSFHESLACAPGPTYRVVCTLAEAVDAKREPCRNCCGLGVVDAYRSLHDAEASE